MERGLELLRQATDRYAAQESPERAGSAGRRNHDEQRSASPSPPQRPLSPQARSLVSAPRQRKSPPPKRDAFPPPTPESQAAHERVVAARRAKEERQRRIDEDVDLVLAQRRAFESGTKASMRMAGNVFGRSATPHAAAGAGGAKRRTGSSRTAAAGGVSANQRTAAATFVDLEFGELVID
jgi:hypothetical protein